MIRWDLAVETVKNIATLLSGALTPIIAMIAVYIAWQQHKTARQKLKLDLYDRRHKIFRGLLDLFAAVMHDGKVSQSELDSYYATTNENKFLFDGDIVAFMTEVREKAVELRRINRNIERLNNAKENTDNESKLDQLIERGAELSQWFDEQLELLTTKFERYLGFKRNL